MTTNLKILIDEKADITLTPIAGSDNSTLTILLGGLLKAWNNGAAANGEVDLDHAGSGNGFPINDIPLDNVMANEISQVEITGPTDILTTFRNLIILKDDVKDIGTNAQDKFDFELTIDKNLKDQGDHWNISDGNDWGNERILKLTVADFGGTLNESKISISDTEYHNQANNTIRVVEDRSTQKQDLLNLEKLLRKTLPTKYKVKVSELDFEKGSDVNDINIIDPGADLGDVPFTANPVPRNGLLAYIVGDVGFGEIHAEANNTKHILHELKGGIIQIFIKMKLKVDCIIFSQDICFLHLV